MISANTGRAWVPKSTQTSAMTLGQSAVDSILNLDIVVTVGCRPNTDHFQNSFLGERIGSFPFELWSSRNSTKQLQFGPVNSGR